VNEDLGEYLRHLMYDKEQVRAAIIICAFTNDCRIVDKNRCYKERAPAPPHVRQGAGEGSDYHEHK
jgi:hypothetical protein